MVYETRNRDVGIYDRSVVQEVLKEIAQTQQVDLNAKKRFKGKSIFSYSLYEHDNGNARD